MIETVEIGSNYAIRLLNIYGGEKYNVNIIGTTNIDNVSSNEDSYNIYETYFKPIGLGLTSYYTAINDRTKIYICRLIKSLDPYETEKSKMFIPETLMDFDNSEEYVKVSAFDFNISSLIRRFESENSNNEYKKEIVEKMKARLKGLIDFTIIDTDIDVTNKEFYMEKSIIEEVEKDRQIAYEDYLQKRGDILKLDKLRETKFNEALSEMNLAKKSYETLAEELNNEKQRYNGLCVSLQAKLDQLNNSEE